MLQCARKRTVSFPSNSLEKVLDQARIISYML